MTDRRLRGAILALALVGFGVAAYLTYVHYEGIRPVCGLGGDCEKVQTSQWSEVGGVPVALIGLIGYALILASLFVPGEAGRLAGAFLALVGFAFSAYLSYRELFSIDAICPWCVVSACVMTLLAVLSAVRLVRAEAQVGRSG
ncbi:MAG: vitamin epoxide reductase family protein [Solirubrobacterales bacterium]|nr:vitamin epoxide reductase family protein [Solirubrobacterales bacterium]